MIRKISFWSDCSVYVVFENVENICLVFSLLNLGFLRCFLYVCWLLEEKKRLFWRRKDVIFKLMKLKGIVINVRKIGSFKELFKWGIRKLF